METCQICQQECSENQQVCSNCGYPFPVTPMLEESSPSSPEVLSQRETWEKEIWQKYEQLQQQQQETTEKNQQLQQQVTQLQQEIANLRQENAKLQQKSESQSSSQQQREVPLESAVGYDYTRLRDLLAKQKWKEADKETAKAMLKVAGRDDVLRVEDIENFPCEDLRTIDRLWVKYSNGKLGFSVQKEIYQKLGGTREFDLNIWRKFGDTVGWREQGVWKNRLELNWKNPTAPNTPRGHLPDMWWDNVAISVVGMWWWVIFSRAETCKL